VKLKDVFSRTKSVSLKKYRIDWDKQSKSKFQFNIKQFFKQYWEYDNCVEEFPVLGTKLNCDLINFDKMFAVEADGNFHNTFSKFHHKNRIGFLNSLRRDQKKDEWLQNNGFFIIRINENDIKNLSLEWVQNTFNIDIQTKYHFNQEYVESSND
jgi:hypothetical protein